MKLLLLVLPCVAFIATTNPLAAQSSDATAVHQILQLEEARRLASLSGDTVTLGRIIAPSFFEIGGAGDIRTRQQNFSQRGAGALRIDSLSFDSIEVHVSGSIAIVTGIVRRSGTAGGVPFSQPPFRYSRIYMREAGEWRIVFGQNTPITRPTSK